MLPRMSAGSGRRSTIPVRDKLVDELLHGLLAEAHPLDQFLLAEALASRCAMTFERASPNQG